MFCKHCNSKLNEGDTKCSFCGKDINNEDILLNPKPTTIHRLMPPEDTSAAELEESVPLEVTDVAAEEVIVSEELLSDMETEAIETMGSDNPAEAIAVEEPSGEEKTVALDYNVRTVNDDNSDTSDELKTQEQLVQDLFESKKKGSKGTFAVIALIIVVLAIALIVLKPFGIKKKQPMPEVTTSAEISDTTEFSGESLGLQETTAHAITVILEDEELQAEDVKCYKSDDTAVSVTTYKLQLDELQAQTYVDRQEVKYQLEDASIKDVKYIGAIFRYHFDGYYQYGLYKEGCLFFYEVTDNLDSENADKLAKEYFESLGVAK